MLCIFDHGKKGLITYLAGDGGGAVDGRAPPLLDGLTPSPALGCNTPIRGFPKIFGNKNAIKTENSPGKIDPPFRNLGLCSKDPPP